MNSVAEWELRLAEEGKLPPERLWAMVRASGHPGRATALAALCEESGFREYLISELETDWRRPSSWPWAAVILGAVETTQFTDESPRAELRRLLPKAARDLLWGDPEKRRRTRFDWESRKVAIHSAIRRFASIVKVEDAAQLGEFLVHDPPVPLWCQSVTCYGIANLYAVEDSEGPAAETLRGLVRAVFANAQPRDTKPSRTALFYAAVAAHRLADAEAPQMLAAVRALSGVYSRMIDKELTP